MHCSSSELLQRQKQAVSKNEVNGGGKAAERTWLAPVETEKVLRKSSGRVVQQVLMSGFGALDSFASTHRMSLQAISSPSTQSPRLG